MHSDDDGNSCWCFGHESTNTRSGLKEISSQKVRQDLLQHLRKPPSSRKSPHIQPYKKHKQSLRRQKHGQLLVKIEKQTQPQTNLKQSSFMQTQKPASKPIRSKKRLSSKSSTKQKEPIYSFKNIRKSETLSSNNRRIQIDSIYQHQQPLKNKLKFTFSSTGLYPKEIESVIDENQLEEDQMSEVVEKLWSNNYIMRRRSKAMEVENSYHRKDQKSKTSNETIQK